MTAVNLAIRFALEVVAIVSVGYWGYRTPTGTPAEVGLAIAAPVVLIAVWAFVVAPGANNPIPQNIRMLIGSGLLLLSTAALAAGQSRLALIVAVVIVVNTILLLVFPAADSPAG